LTVYLIYKEYGVDLDKIEVVVCSYYFDYKYNVKVLRTKGVIDLILRIFHKYMGIYLI